MFSWSGADFKILYKMVEHLQQLVQLTVSINEIQSTVRKHPKIYNIKGIFGKKIKNTYNMQDFLK